MRISNAEKTIRLRKLKSERGLVLVDGLVKLAFLCLAVGVFIFLNYGIYVVSGNDMYPAVRDGDVAIVYRHPEYINGDVVITKRGNKYRAARIQATNGSTISVTNDGHLTIDGNMQPVQERSGIYGETLATDGNDIGYPYRVEAGSVMLLGDNRESAEDSRSYGQVDKSELLGKTFMIVRRRAI